MSRNSDSTYAPVTLLHSRQKFDAVEQEDVPKGKLRMIITHLEMTKMPNFPHQSKRAENLSIIRARQPTSRFYRFLYTSVGQDWLWYERSELADEQLEKIIKHPKVRIYVLYVNGTPAGYSELDCRLNNEVELAYFGLMPEFMGRGLGLYFLRWSVEKAWSEEPERVWVHTCNFDSPHAIAIYQKAGFSAYKQETIVIDDPHAPKDQ